MKNISAILHKKKCNSLCLQEWNSASKATTPSPGGHVVLLSPNSSSELGPGDHRACLLEYTFDRTHPFKQFLWPWTHFCPFVSSIYLFPIKCNTIHTKKKPTLYFSKLLIIDITHLSLRIFHNYHSSVVEWHGRSPLLSLSGEESSLMLIQWWKEVL
jgi:hypothetical protein